MSATERLARIVSIVAELSRREREGEPDPTLEELAGSHGVAVAQIQEDIRTLTLLGDHCDSEWLLSLSVWQQDDRVAVRSQGPFRRPIRLAPEELLAVRVALLSEPEGESVLEALSGLGSGTEAPAPVMSRPVSRHDLLAHAVAERKVLEVQYAGSSDGAARARVVEPHQLVEWEGRGYLVAWCRGSEDWRHFRLDRVLSVREEGGQFEPRSGFRHLDTPESLFRAGEDAVEQVRVRFTPSVARWARERWPAHDPRADGGVEVGFQSGSVDWLVRRVLEFGDGAEVIEPQAYREAVRQAVE